MKIFIDPGHGGTDSGALSKAGIREADINLDVSLKLGGILQLMGYIVRYSRTDDVNVSLSKRAEMANGWNSKYYISIHCNSIDDINVGGCEALFYKPYSIDEQLADIVRTYLVQATRLKDRGIKDRDLAVLRLTKMPAILVELAFISNEEEAHLLSTNSFRQKCADGIAEGIIRF